MLCSMQHCETVPPIRFAVWVRFAPNRGLRHPIDRWTGRSRLRYDDFMPRKPNPLQSALQEAVRGAIADDARAVERKARQEARRQEREADAALAATDPLSGLRERLNQIEEQLAGLKRAHQQKGDALAARLIETLERERALIFVKLGR